MVMLYLALLPAAALLLFVYKKDRVEKEPTRLILALVGLGAATTVSAVVLGLILDPLALRFFPADSWGFVLVENFIVIALVEEGGKFVVLKLKTWRSPEFNYSFDGVVYAVAVSLGFAALENIVYVLGDTMNTAIGRAIFAVPGHAIDGVFMGSFYGIAKQLELRGDVPGSRRALRRALIVPTLIHGFYDFCLSVDYDIFMLVFLAFEIVITLLAIRRLNRLSREDAPLDPFDAGPAMPAAPVPPMPTGRRCQSCGAALPDGAKFCIECGAPNRIETQAAPTWHTVSQ